MKRSGARTYGNGRKTVWLKPCPASSLAVVPADLRRWVNEPTLVGWVLEAVSGVDVHRSQPLSSNHPPLAAVLSVLTYCYAVGLYLSEEIEEASRGNATVRYLALDQFLASGRIRQFRRVHQDLLRACLHKVHQQAWEHRFGDSPPGRHTGSGAGGQVGRGPVFLACRLRAQAEQRIQQAVLADTMALDV